MRAGRVVPCGGQFAAQRRLEGAVGEMQPEDVVVVVGRARLDGQFLGRIVEPGEQEFGDGVGLADLEWCRGGSTTGSRGGEDRRRALWC